MNDSIIDTLYFGTFAKASIVFGDSSMKNFVYCAGPKALFKIVENEDNIIDLAQQLLDEKLSQLSVSVIANLCNTTSETVN